MFENPHGVPHDEIVRMILDNPPEVSAQTVFGKYVESSGLVFTGELVQMLFNADLPRVIGSSYLNEERARQAMIWHEQNPMHVNKRWFTGIDFARQTDHTVIFTIDTITEPAEVVYFRRLNRVPWEAIYAEVGKAVHYFGKNVLADSTGPGGDVVMSALEDSLYCSRHNRVNRVGSRCMDGNNFRDCNPQDYIRLSCVEGFTFSAGSKKELVDHLRLVLSFGYSNERAEQAFGNLRSPRIVALEEELSFYAWDDKRLDTDCVFALALAAWAGLESPVGNVSVGSTMGR